MKLQNSSLPLPKFQQKDQRNFLASKKSPSRTLMGLNQELRLTPLLIFQVFEQLRIQKNQKT